MAATAVNSHDRLGGDWKRQILHKIAAAISAQLNLAQIMEMACEAATQFCAGDHSAILLLSENREEGKVASEYGEGLRAMGKVISLRNSPAQHELFSNGQPIVVSDTADPTVSSYLGSLQGILSEQNIDSILIVPIQNGNCNIGSLSLDSLGRKRHFTEQDLQDCKQIATLVAIAVERDQAIARIQKAFGDLLSQHDPQKVLVFAVEHAAKLLQARDAGVYIYNSNKHKLRLCYVLKSPETRLHKMLNYGEGMAGTLLKTGEPFVYTPDYRKYDARSHEFDAMPFEAVLEALIKDDGKTVGVLFVESSAGRVFQPVEIALLCWLADQTAVALRNAELFDIQKSRLHLLHDAAQPFIESEKTEAGLGKLAEAIVQCLDSSFCRILLMDDRGTELIPKVHVVMNPGRMVTSIAVDPKPICIKEWSNLGRLLDRGEPQLLHYSDSVEIQRHLEVFSTYLKLSTPVQSLLLVPLKSDGRVIGLIDVGDLHAEQSESLSKERLDLIRTVAHQVAVIAARERRTRLRKDLVRLSQHLGGEKERKRLLHETLRLSTELFPGTMGIMFDLNLEFNTLEPAFTENLPFGKKAFRLLVADDSLAGAAALRRDLVSVTSTAEWKPGEEIFGSIAGGAIVAVPLQAGGDVEAVLVLCDPGGQWLRLDREPEGLEVLELFASRASSALAVSQLISADPRLVGQLTRLHPVIDYMLKAQDLKQLLLLFLTGVTAGYALGFNRAVVFLTDPDEEYLVGRMAIGDADFWARKTATSSDFAHFTRTLNSGTLPSSEFDRAVEKLRIPIRKDGDILAQSFLEKRWKRFEPNEAKNLHPDFRDLFASSTEFLVMPLIANESIGVLVVDNKFSKSPITDIEETVLLGFAHRSAVTIQNRLALELVLSEHERLQPLYEASTALFISENFQQVGEKSVNSLLKASGGCGVRGILVDDRGQLKRYFFAGRVSDYGPGEILQQDEISRRVLSDHTCRCIPDCQREEDKDKLRIHRPDDGAVICVPITAQERTIGIFWIGYSRVHHFSSAEIQALHLFGAQAGIAYDAALKFEASQVMFDAAHTRPADENGYKDLLKTVLSAARSLFNALGVTIWPFDAGSHKFVRQDLVAIGIPDDVLEQFRDHEPQDHQVTFTVLEDGYMAIPNLATSDEKSLSEHSRGLAERAGIRAFQAIRLKNGDDLLGVLYVSYAAPRTFKPEDRNQLETFAQGVSQTLQNARLHLETHKARRAAQALAEMTALSGDDPSKLFDAITKKARDLLRCHVIVLVAYDQTADRFTSPYFIDGAKSPQWEGKEPQFPHDSWIYDLLNLEKEKVIEEVDSHPEYKDRHFARTEGIKTLMVIVLRATNRTVGLMFLNYREYHRFTEDEKANIHLVASQISIAIRNAQIYAERKSFEEFAQSLLLCSTASDIAQTAAEQAAEMLGMDFSDVVLEETDGIYRANSWIGWPDSLQKVKFVEGTGSHSGFTIWSEKTITVSDFDKETRFKVHELIKQHGIRGGMGTCLYEDLEPIGALLVHSKNRRNYGPDEQRLLEQIANQTTAAMLGRRSYEKEVERRSEHALAILRALRSINVHSGGLNSDKIFAQILEQASRLCEYKAHVATLHRYDEETKHLTLDAVYPQEQYQHLKNLIGTRWSLREGYPGSGKIGVTGRAVLDEKPILVSNVTEHNDFLSLTGKSRSEMAIPLFDNHKVVGVINLESKAVGTFNEEHRQAVRTLGEMIVIVMRNVRDYEELKQTITRLDSRTALAWITTTKNYWGHSLENATTAIRNNLVLMRQDLNSLFHHSIPAAILAELQEIESLIKYSEDKPVTPPLSSQEGLMPVLINELLKERISQLQRNRNLSEGVKLAFDPQVDHGMRIQVSEEWFLRAVNLVIENALKELRKPGVDPSDRRIEVTTRPGRKDGIEISFRDYGPGIRENIREKIFREVIPKGKDESGLGIGMLMVRTIVETYSGTVRLGTPEKGAEIVMWFPKSELAH